MRLSRQAHDREICRRHFEAHLALWWNRALLPPFFSAVHNTPLLASTGYSYGLYDKSAKETVRTTPVRSQQCECQQCERVNSAN